jgi:hypothetical protein
MKKIAGLDLGTNTADASGKPCKIEGPGSRIIPMSQETLSDFDKGFRYVKKSVYSLRVQGFVATKAERLM